MATLKISEYPNTVTVFQGTDLMDVSVDLGGGSYESQKVTWTTVVSSTGIYGLNGTVGSSRVATVTDNFTWGGDAKIIRYGVGGGAIQTSDSSNAQLEQFDLFGCQLANALDSNNQNITSVQNLGVGTFQFGTGANGVIALGVNSAPTSENANTIQIYTTTGQDCIIRDETGVTVDALAGSIYSKDGTILSGRQVDITDTLSFNTTVASQWQVDSNGNVGQGINAGTDQKYFMQGTGQFYGFRANGTFNQSNFGCTGGGTQAMYYGNQLTGNHGLWIDTTNAHTSNRTAAKLDVYGSNTASNIGLVVNIANGAVNTAIDVIAGDTYFRKRGTATGTADQKGSHPIFVGNSLWDGFVEEVRYFDIQSVPSTTVNEETFLSFGYEGSSGISMRQDGVLIAKEFLVGSLPSAVAGGIIRISDEAGGDTIAYSDGTNWRRVSDGAVAS